MHLDISESSSFEYSTRKHEDLDDVPRIKSPRDPDSIQIPESPDDACDKNFEFSPREHSDSYSGNQSSSSEDENNKRPTISYPPSPLSTEFETTESSEIGIEHYTIPNRDN